jgi:hypothetical protein
MRRPWFVLTLNLVLALTLLGAVEAAPIEGTILGQVRDLDTGEGVAGVTVIADGPEGDTATITDSKGNYEFRALPIGPYVMRFHRNNVVTERPARVSVDKTVRVNMRMPAVPGETQTAAVSYAPPAIDVGSSRIGATFSPEFIANVPNQGADVSSLIQKTPGAYNEPIQVSPSASVPGLSLSGGTGADNAYYLEGLNITALRDGLLGTNLNVLFLEEAEVISAGYGAEYGRALGGVVNMALKSGTNEWKGSAYSWVQPGWAAGSAKRVLSRSTVLSGVNEPEYTTQMGAEVGGPIIKDRVFLWLGYAPEIGRSHFIQYVDRFSPGANGDIASNPDGSPKVDNLFTRVIPGESTTHNYAGKLTWRIRPEHELSLSLVGVRKDEEYMRGANMDLLAGMTHDETNRQDVIARWQSALFDRKWRIDASLGLHTESYSRHSPYGDAESMDDVNWKNSPSLSQFNPSLAGLCSDPSDPSFDRCPVQGYQSGGFGIMRETSAYRLAGQIKSTHIFSGFGAHELKYGIDYEFIQYDDKRWNSGPDGARGSVYMYPGENDVYSLYRLPYGKNSLDVADPTLLTTTYYQDSIRARTRAYNNALFLQESYVPISNLTINVGARWEAQRFTDYAGNNAFTIGNSLDAIAPRVGIVYDPTKDGRAKIFAHYGRYYESVPMDLINRAFGGEGDVIGAYDPSCPAQGWRGCAPLGAFSVGGDRLVVQPNIKGAYNNEVVLGGQYQPLPDLVLGASLIYRWLGRAIEDGGGSVASGMGSSMLINPGRASDATVAALDQQASALEAAANQPGASPADIAAAALARAKANVAQGPNPERTYKAAQLTINKRVARNWFFAGSYTYSRTEGNYAGLYSADSKQLDPNLTTQYDVVELMQNRKGPLPNDRPHVIHLDGYYQLYLGRHGLVPGLSFVGYSGVPITPLGRAPVMGENETFILPRGSAGRTPFVTQLDAHLSYRTKLGNGFSVEGFVDIFNVLNQRTALSQDAEYTVDTVMPQSAGTSLKQVPVVNGSGQCVGADATTGVCPATPTYAKANPNYLQPTSFQAPISGRLGLRVWF